MLFKGFYSKILIAATLVILPYKSWANQCQSIFQIEQGIVLSPGLKSKLEQHHRDSSLKIGGMTLERAFQQQNFISSMEEFYTPENAKMALKMAVTLEEFIRVPSKFDVNMDQLNTILKNSDYPVEKIFDFVWSSQDVQNLIRKALEVYKEVIQSQYAQEKVLEFLDLYTTVLSIPYYLAMHEERIDRESALSVDSNFKNSPNKDKARDRFLLEKIIYRLNSREFRDYMEREGPVKYVQSLSSYRGNRISEMEFGRKTFKFRAVLIDAIESEYEIARFFHLGIVPVGVFTTTSVAYDNEIDSNLSATGHDVETHWKFYANISFSTNRTPLNSLVHKVRNEVAAFVIDKLLEGSSKIQREDLAVSRVFQSIHEEGRGTMAKVLRAIIYDYGQEWFERSVSNYLTPAEIAEVYQIIGYKVQEDAN